MRCLACFTFPFASFSSSCLFYSGQRQCLTVYKGLLTLWSLFSSKEWAKWRKAKLERWREICGTIYCTNHTSSTSPKEIFLSVWGSSLSQSRNQSLLKPALKFIWTDSTQQKSRINIQIKSVLLCYCGCLKHCCCGCTKGLILAQSCGVKFQTQRWTHDCCWDNLI